MTTRNRLLIAMLVSTFACTSFAGFKKMTIEFSYKGEKLWATFYSSATFTHLLATDTEYQQVTSLLEQLRRRFYLERSRRESSDEDRGRHARENEVFIDGFFEWEPLQLHDEVMVIHRHKEDLVHAMEEYRETGRIPEHAVDNIRAMIAIDRTGAHPMNASDELLVEQRLGQRISRPFVGTWDSPYLPPGVFPHWNPEIAHTYFQPGRIIYGDVIQANALFAHDGMWPLLHTLANSYGLFSTGRLLAAGESVQLGPVRHTGPAVFIPTCVVWEVFHKPGKKSSRAAYYEKSGAQAMLLGGATRRRDPRMPGLYDVEVLFKTGIGFREGWTEYFAKQESFVAVRDVEIHSTSIDTFPRFKHSTHNLRDCSTAMLDATRQPVVEEQIPLTISIGFGTPTMTVNGVTTRLDHIQLPPPVSQTFHIPHARRK